MKFDDLPDWLSADDLELLGLSPDEIRDDYPHASERTALDGSRCWHRDELTARMPIGGGDES